MRGLIIPILLLLVIGYVAVTAHGERVAAKIDPTFDGTVTNKGPACCRKVYASDGKRVISFRAWSDEEYRAIQPGWIVRRGACFAAPILDSAPSSR